MRISLLLLSCVLAACGSAPVRLHTLTPPASAPAAAMGDYAVAVQDVSVPAQLDVPQLVMTSGSTGLVLVESEHWAAPLPDEIRNALAAQLSAKLGVAEVAGLRVPSAVPVYGVRVDVRRFESALESQAVLEAGWSLQLPGAEAPALACISRIKVGVDGEDYPDVVQGHQKALEKLAAKIAGAIRVARAGDTPACPRK